MDKAAITVIERFMLDLTGNPTSSTEHTRELELALERAGYIVVRKEECSKA